MCLQKFAKYNTHFTPACLRNLNPEAKPAAASDHANQLQADIIYQAIRFAGLSITPLLKLWKEEISMEPISKFDR